MKISTGSQEFDEFLDGGYENDIITTLYGPAGSGKSNFCMMAAVELAKKGKKVIFIDTEGGFSVDRLKQLGAEDCMKHILLLKATNFNEQREVFNKLLAEIRKDIGLIVVDSIAMLYRLEIGNARGEGNDSKVNSINRCLAWQLKVLSEIARKKNIPIIVTNQVYSDFVKNPETQEKKVHMVGGDLLKYWSKCIIELKREKERRKVVLRKHRSLPEKELSFSITNRGISKQGFRLF